VANKRKRKGSQLRNIQPKTPSRGQDERSGGTEEIVHKTYNDPERPRTTRGGKGKRRTSTTSEREKVGAINIGNRSHEFGGREPNKPPPGRRKRIKKDRELPKDAEESRGTLERSAITDRKTTDRQYKSLPAAW